MQKTTRPKVKRLTMTERLGECWNCEESEVPVFAEGGDVGRDYCQNCIQTCVFCGEYCDTYACANDEGDCHFEVHDCQVDGEITCNREDDAIANTDDTTPKIKKAPCKYRYCMSCTEKCPACNFNIIIRGSGECRYCQE